MEDLSNLTDAELNSRLQHDAQQSIDVEIEACEIAMDRAFGVVEAEELAKHVATLIQRRHLLERNC